MSTNCKIVSIWAGSMLDAHTFINRNELGQWFVQFVSDTLMPRGAVWMVFNFPPHLWAEIKESEFKPRLTVLE